MTFKTNTFMVLEIKIMVIWGWVGQVFGTRGGFWAAVHFCFLNQDLSL